MKVESSRFGTCEAEETDLYSAPEGLPGLAGRAFLLVAPEGLERPFWLQSLAAPEQAVLLIDPRSLDAGYDPAPGVVSTLLGGSEGGLLLRVVAWPGEEEGKLYANLFAPVWLAPALRLVAQSPMVGSGRPVRGLFELPRGR